MSPVARWTLVALLLAPAPALAQSAEREARRLFDEGVALMEDGRTAEALDHLERARALHEVPAIVYNLALAQRSVGRYVDAAASLERYVTLAGERLSAARRRECAHMLDELRAALARVTVRVTVEGAAVTVDDHALGPDEVGQEIALDPGRHMFRAAGPALEPADEVRELARGERATVVLAPVARPTTGAIEVASTTPGAVIYIDGRRAGAGSVQEDVAPGRHVVEVRAPGWTTWRDAVVVRVGRVEHLQPALAREASGGILTRWWFWTGVGVVAAGAATALVVGLSDTDAPVPGTLNQVVQAHAAP